MRSIIFENLFGWISYFLIMQCVREIPPTSLHASSSPSSSSPLFSWLLTLHCPFTFSIASCALLLKRSYFSFLFLSNQTTSHFLFLVFLVFFYSLYATPLSWRLTQTETSKFWFQDGDTHPQVSARSCSSVSHRCLVGSTYGLQTRAQRRPRTASTMFRRFWTQLVEQPLNRTANDWKVYCFSPE